MKCKNCGKEMQEAYTDFVASYIKYVERYVNCFECKTVNVIRYEEVKTVGTYPMTRDDENIEKEKCHYENKSLQQK